MELIRKHTQVANKSSFDVDDVVIDEFGYIRLSAVILKSGMMLYSKDELFGNDVPEVIDKLFPNSDKVQVWISDDDISGYEEFRSFEGKAVTNLHPPEMVTSDNHNDFSVGSISAVSNYESAVSCVISIHDKDTIEGIQSKDLSELSSAYYSDLYISDDNRIYQNNFSGNHVAFVPVGRCGADCSIKYPMWNKKSGINNTMKVQLNKDNSVEIEDANVAALIKAAIDSASNENDTLAGQVKALNASLQEAKSGNLTESQIQERVEARNSITKYLPDDFDSKGKSDSDLKVAVIEANNNGLKVEDGKSNGFIDGMFDVVTSTMNANNEGSFNRAPAGSNSNDNSELSHEEQLWKRQDDANHVWCNGGDK